MTEREKRYTPGPWEYIGTEETDDVVIQTKVHGVINDDEVLGVSEWCRLKDADGFLMAAAPELYEALESAPSPDDLDFTNPERFKRIYAEWFASRHLAIAKAYGETQ